MGGEPFYGFIQFQAGVLGHTPTCASGGELHIKLVHFTRDYNCMWCYYSENLVQHSCSLDTIVEMRLWVGEGRILGKLLLPLHSKKPLVAREQGWPQLASFC
ncbi:hypothetical protein KIL84_020049 [Mauremys mutica]|uniref:Uncharacterized protein n=1 Tax=Mauremys mutica TaxID=74926 RepID=A0A9D3XY35_9SAUR|nr:hypothetical protein KIL84_020049 [Mauremys mutica]